MLKPNGRLNPKFQSIIYNQKKKKTKEKKTMKSNNCMIIYKSQTTNQNQCVENSKTTHMERLRLRRNILQQEEILGWSSLLKVVVFINGLLINYQFFIMKSLRHTYQNIKVSCAYHPGNNIRSFCANQDCLLPLCRLCEHIHSNEHVNYNSSFKPQPIQQSLSIAVDESEYFLSALHILQECIFSLNKERQKKADMISKKLEQIKNMMDEYSKINNGLYLMQKSVQSRINYFNDIKSHLSSDEFLEPLIYLHLQATKRQQRTFIKTIEMKLNVLLFNQQFLQHQQQFNLNPNIQQINEGIEMIRNAFKKTKELTVESPIKLIENKSFQNKQQDTKSYLVSQNMAFASPLDKLVIKRRKIRRQNHKDQIKKQIGAYLPINRSRMMKSQQMFVRPNAFSNKKYLD